MSERLNQRSENAEAVEVAEKMFEEGIVFDENSLETNHSIMDELNLDLKDFYLKFDVDSFNQYKESLKSKVRDFVKEFRYSGVVEKENHVDKIVQCDGNHEGRGLFPTRYECSNSINTDIRAKKLLKTIERFKRTPEEVEQIKKQETEDKIMKKADLDKKDLEKFDPSI